MASESLEEKLELFSSPLQSYEKQ